LTREALAFHSGLSWSAIAQVEAGRRTNVRPHTLQSLARALGVTIDYLVSGGGAPTPMLVHRALLYSTESEFLDVCVPFLTQGVERGEAVLAVTTEANLALLRGRLGRAARAVELAERDGWYCTPMTAVHQYREFLTRKLDSGAAWVRILGEPPRSMRPKGKSPLSARYESMLNLVFTSEPVSVLCPYDKRELGDEIQGQATVTHPETVGPNGTVGSPNYADPLELVLEP
jgi:transcriptional regulator with XRE-family HTH domain